MSVGSDMLGAHTLAVSRNGRLYSLGTQGVSCLKLRLRYVRPEAGAMDLHVALGVLPMPRAE